MSNRLMMRARFTNSLRQVRFGLGSRRDYYNIVDGWRVNDSMIEDYDYGMARTTKLSFFKSSVASGTAVSANTNRLYNTSEGTGCDTARSIFMYTNAYIFTSDWVRKVMWVRQSSLSAMASFSSRISALAEEGCTKSRRVGFFLSQTGPNSPRICALAQWAGAAGAPSTDFGMT